MNFFIKFYATYILGHLIIHFYLLVLLRLQLVTVILFQKQKLEKPLVLVLPFLRFLYLPFSYRIWKKMIKKQIIFQVSGNLGVKIFHNLVYFIIY